MTNYTLKQQSKINDMVRYLKKLEDCCFQNQCIQGKVVDGICIANSKTEPEGLCEICSYDPRNY